MKIMEAVPNISEGRRPEIITAVAQAAQAACAEAKLLHIDSNPDANRTVLTIAGTPNGVRLASFAVLKTAARLIDMRVQHGAHPRLGATDVCPFVPVRDMTLKEASQQAVLLAREAAERLQIPIYLYESNATSPERKDLAFLRRGEYESLPQKLKELPPDAGPCSFSGRVAKTGATVIGARNILIAFNISLNTTDTRPAKEIASVLRENSGGLRSVKAIGWLMPNYHAAQVSFNLTDYRQTGLAQVFEACRQEASKRGLQTTGSELIGLAPEEALLEAGRFYIPLTNQPAVLIEEAVRNLGLNKIRPFDAHRQILEYRLKEMLQTFKQSRIGLG